MKEQAVQPAPVCHDRVWPGGSANAPTTSRWGWWSRKPGWLGAAFGRMRTLCRPGNFGDVQNEAHMPGRKGKSFGRCHRKGVLHGLHGIVAHVTRNQCNHCWCGQTEEWAMSNEAKPEDIDGQEAENARGVLGCSRPSGSTRGPTIWAKFTAMVDANTTTAGPDSWIWSSPVTELACRTYSDAAHRPCCTGALTGARLDLPPPSGALNSRSNWIFSAERNLETRLPPVPDDLARRHVGPRREHHH